MPEGSVAGVQVSTGRGVGEAATGASTPAGGVMSTVVEAVSELALALPAASVATTV